MSVLGVGLCGSDGQVLVADERMEAAFDGAKGRSLLEFYEAANRETVCTLLEVAKSMGTVRCNTMRLAGIGPAWTTLVHKVSRGFEGFLVVLEKGG